jgi:hypothetical protein
VEKLIELNLRPGQTVTQMFDDFERVLVNKTRSNSKLTVEPSIAIGSGGIVYALYKYLILLQKQSRVSGNY